jgi:hydroxyacylglutathione hydrolase
LKITDRDTFTAYMQGEQRVKPANILNIVAINQGKRPLTREIPKAKALSPQTTDELIAQGHVVVDARTSAEFGAGHVPGAFNVQMESSEFEQRVGWVTPADVPLILVTNTAAEAQRCIYNMAFIALDTRVSGYLAGGMDSWMDAGKMIQTIPQIDVHTLHRKLSANGLQVLDVRDDEEWEEGHIEGAHNMAYTSLAAQLDIPAQIDNLPIDHNQHLAVTCATGKRSSTAVSMLLRHGFKNLYNVTGGMEAWKNAGFKMLDGSGNTRSI